MGSAKEIKKKIKSISNTRKITRTMEMVSAAKSKKTTRRVKATTPYFEKLGDLLETLCAGANVDHEFLVTERDGRRERTVNRNALLVVTANRGLCGGYNASVVQLAERWLEAQRRRGRETDVSMIGKKGISRFRFNQLPLHAAYDHIGDRPTFEEAQEIARGFMDRFRRGEVDRVLVISTRYFSAGTQQPERTQLLPIKAPAGDEYDGGEPRPDFIFEPDPETILHSLVPFSVSYKLFRLLVEAAACEQVARRIAMKLATDNADELVKIYTRRYNRQRQAGITQQIMEIVGGAEGLG